MFLFLILMIAVLTDLLTQVLCPWVFKKKKNALKMPLDPNSFYRKTENGIYCEL